MPGTEDKDQILILVYHSNFVLFFNVCDLQFPNMGRLTMGSLILLTVLIFYDCTFLGFLVK